MEPTNTQVLIVICDHGVEDNAMFSTNDLDARGGGGWREKDERKVFICIPSKPYGLMVYNAT